MKTFIRFSAVASIALIGLGLLSPAQAQSPLTITDIYNPMKIVDVQLTLPQSSYDSLNSPATRDIYVPGSLTLSLDGKSSGSLNIKVRLKGSTSMYNLDETPSFKIKFKKDINGNGYLGLNRMTFNGMVQDNSKVHEYATYALFNAVGLPAPKTGWVRLSVNGVAKGLFINVEQPDHPFMQKRFKDITQHVYEGIAMRDFNLGNDTGDDQTGAFQVDYGWKVTPNKRDLTKAINYASDWDPVTWYRGLNTVFDRTEMIKFFAAENFVGHWDGYTGPDINNYFIRSNTKGKFSFIPWGADQTFGENRGTEALGDTYDLPLISDYGTIPFSTHSHYRGKLYVTCVNYSLCRTEYLKDLKEISAKATSMKLASKMKAVAAVIEPELVKQFGSDPAMMDLIHSEQKRNLTYITLKQGKITKALARYKIK